MGCHGSKFVFCDLDHVNNDGKSSNLSCCCCCFATLTEEIQKKNFGRKYMIFFTMGDLTFSTSPRNPK